MREGRPLKEPHVRTRRCELDVPETLAADLGANSALVQMTPQVASCACTCRRGIPVCDGPKIARAEQASRSGLRYGSGWSPASDFGRVTSYGSSPAKARLIEESKVADLRCLDRMGLERTRSLPGHPLSRPALRSRSCCLSLCTVPLGKRPETGASNSCGFPRLNWKRKPKRPVSRRPADAG